MSQDKYYGSHGENAKQKILEKTKGRDFQVIKITDLYGNEKKQEKEEER